MHVQKRVMAIATNSDTVAVEFIDGSVFCCEKGTVRYVSYDGILRSTGIVRVRYLA